MQTIPNNARHIPPGETRPACNRCQYVARTADVEGCPYCGGNWTHDVTNPGGTTALRATPPAPEAPTAAAEAGELSTRNVTYLSAEDVAHVTTGRRYISMSEGVVLAGTSYFRELQLAAEQAANATKVAEDAFQEAARLQQELAEARGYADHLQHAHAQRERHLAREAYTRGFAGSAQGYNAEIGPDCEKWPAWKGQREVDVEDILSHPEEWMPAPTPPATPEAREAGGEGPDDCPSCGNENVFHGPGSICKYCHQPYAN